MVFGRDPLEFLSLEGDDFRIALAALRDAEEYDRDRLDYLASKIAVVIMKAMGVAN